MKKILDIQPEDYFYLSDNFIDKYKRKQPKWGPLGYVVTKRTYARPITSDKSEEFWQLDKRVVEACYTLQKWHCRHFGLPFNAHKAQYSAQTMYDLIWNFKFLPPGRGLWGMHIPLLEKVGASVLLNCAHVSTKDINLDFSYPFCFLMDFSMLGVGVGSDTRGVGKIRIREPKYDENLVHVISDDREGWVEIIRRILDSYVGKDTFPCKIDYLNIRPKGALIKSMGGIAPGPKPLKKLVDGIKEILDPIIDLPITSTAITDLFNKIGVCVVSGNIRRSAELIIGDKNDDEFISLKDPTKYKKELRTHRWASNNSIFADIGMNYSKIAKLTGKNGEPNYIWIDTARKFRRLKDKPDNSDLNVSGFNPCAEQQLENNELCCLVETFPSFHDSYEEYEKTLKYAYLYAKTVTLIPTHNAPSNAVMMKNRRIGLSQSGIVQSFAKHGRRTHFEWCDNGYKFIRGLDEKYSDWLAIPRSKRVTTVKPSGTVSLLPGVTPGIHYEHSAYYYRTMRIASASPLVGALTNAGYRVEKALEDPDNTVVVYFPVKAEHFDRSKSDISMWEQLENTAQMQYYWSDNAVSVTVTFKPDEAKDIEKALELYETRLKTVSFLPLEDHQYEQAPYIEISEKDYDKASSKITNLKLKENVHDQQEKFCDGQSCELK